MILPGTLVQLVKDPRGVPGYRRMGVYTVQTSGVTICCGTVLFVCEVPDDVGKCSCNFRILAPPITEADRLEMTEPQAPGKSPAAPLPVQPASAQAPGCQ